MSTVTTRGNGDPATTTESDRDVRLKDLGTEDYTFEERYSRLELVDQAQAASLSQFCRINSEARKSTVRLANLSAVQSAITAIPLALADWYAFICVFSHPQR